METLALTTLSFEAEGQTVGGYLQESGVKWIDWEDAGSGQAWGVQE